MADIMAKAASPHDARAAIRRGLVILVGSFVLGAVFENAGWGGTVAAIAASVILGAVLALLLRPIPDTSTAPLTRSRLRPTTWRSYDKSVRNSFVQARFPSVPHSFGEGRPMRRGVAISAFITFLVATPVSADTPMGGHRDGENRPAPETTAVTEEMLRAPAGADWLTHLGSREGWNYSTLRQIGRRNVSRLSYVWSFAVDARRSEVQPLVHGGVMYVNEGGDVIRALNAATGAVYWTYRHPNPEGLYHLAYVNRGVALYGDRVFVATSDAHLVALDARTGDVVWDREVADHASGFHYSGAPFIADGKLIAGMSGCYLTAPGGCWVSAHDPATGEEVWRVNTLQKSAAIGPVAEDTWGGVPDERRLGGSVWATPTYDADTNTIYAAPAVPIPWGRAQRPVQDKLLYTNATLAIDASSGEIRWFAQHSPNDNWDMDHMAERIVVDADVRPDPDHVRWINTSAGQGPRSIVVNALGKHAIVFAYDRLNGEFLWARETVHQNVVADVDLATGTQIADEDLILPIGEAQLVCPHFTGGKQWPATSYNPRTGLIYLPLNNTCMNYSLNETMIRFGEHHRSATVTPAPVPEPHATEMIGRLEAIDVSTGETRWRHDQRAPIFTSALTTASGLVFTGGVDGVFRALDARNGNELWSVQLNTSVQGFPTTFEVDGRQYLAVSTGGALNYNVLTPEIVQPQGATVYVFALGR